jgi:hypothetical protein
MVFVFVNIVTPRHRDDQLKIISRLEKKKKTDIWHLLLLKEKVLFKESSPSIMVIRNPKLVNKDSMVRDWLRKREDVITP